MRYEKEEDAKKLKELKTLDIHGVKVTVVKDKVLKFLSFFLVPGKHSSVFVSCCFTLSLNFQN